MQLETKFKNKIRPLLNAIPNSIWFKIQQVSLRGVPDFLGCINGRFVALELKKDSKSRPTPLQVKVLLDITKAGGYSWIVCPENFEEIYAQLREI